MPTEDQFVTCPCTYCGGNVEFECTGFEVGQLVSLICPHCSKEFSISVSSKEIPKPPVLNKPLADTTDSIFKTYRPPAHEGAYMIILAPGVVRYFSPLVFWKSDVESVIGAIKRMTELPEIKPPEASMERWVVDFYGKCDEPPTYAPIFFSSHFNSILEGESWETMLRVHHSFGHFLLYHRLPSNVYLHFHSTLNLGKTLVFDECVAAWIPDAMKNWDLGESYLRSSEHLAFFSKDFSVNGAFYVYAKTGFVRERLGIMAQQFEERDAAEEADRLTRSGFSNFIYIMEDLRNGAFKIGRSITPGKRERTLQSEVPEIVMRFSIPAEEFHEKILHDHFEEQNLRGEWFRLSNDDLVYVISYLKQHGDVERVSGNFDWLGQIFLKAKRI